MIRLQRLGSYRLIETKKLVKVLYLDDDVFAWPETAEYGEMLVTSHNPHKTDRVLSVGEFRLYDVSDEAKLTDLPHLELQLGDSSWQGYLLLTGLPNNRKRRGRIIPTHETIAGSPEYRKRIDLHNMVMDCSVFEKDVGVSEKIAA